jgi:hypothetical protein
MTRHPFRWDSLILGLFFLTVVGTWAVWKQDLFTTRQLSLTMSGVLIFLGVVGVAATFWKTLPAPAVSPHDPEPAQTTPEGPEDEEALPQP